MNAQATHSLTEILLTSFVVASCGYRKKKKQTDSDSRKLAIIPPVLNKFLNAKRNFEQQWYARLEEMIEAQRLDFEKIKESVIQNLEGITRSKSIIEDRNSEL